MVLDWLCWSSKLITSATNPSFGSVGVAWVGGALAWCLESTTYVLWLDDYYCCCYCYLSWEEPRFLLVTEVSVGGALGAFEGWWIGSTSMTELWIWGSKVLLPPSCPPPVLLRGPAPPLRNALEMRVALPTLVASLPCPLSSTRTGITTS